MCMRWHGQYVFNMLMTFALIAVVCGGLLFAYFALTLLGPGIDDAYALWGAGDMLIDYMETQGEWPRSWDDLRPQFDLNNGRVGGWSFAEYQERIRIDFTADPEELRRKSIVSPYASFRVIWARRDCGVRVGDDPNQMLCNYFRQKHIDGVDPGPGGGENRRRLAFPHPRLRTSRQPASGVVCRSIVS